jgi:hypothetical protein
MPEPPNKGMKLTSVEHTERSQLIPGVGQTVGGAEWTRKWSSCLVVTV